MNEPIPKLRTVDGAALMSLPLRPPNFVVNTLLSQGLHILEGSPKVGKSWLALWLAVTVAKGEPVWNMTTKQGTTLYLCLEDSVLRIQNRLFEITEDAPDSVHFCTECAPIGQGLEEQVEEFLAQHSDTVLMIVDILDDLEQRTAAHTALLQERSGWRGWYPIQEKMEALTGDVAQMRRILQQAGNRKERRFSLPSIHLPRPHLPHLDGPTWATLLMILAGLVLLWLAWGGYWSKLSLLLP